MPNNLTLLFEYSGIMAIMMLLPFVHIIYAIIEKKDVDPLPVNLNYTKNPRYIAKQFEKYFLSSVNIDALTLHDIYKSKKLGLIEIHSHKNPFKKHYKGILYLPDATQLPRNTTVRKQIFAENRIRLLESCQVDAIRAKGEVIIGDNVCISRWVDSDAPISIGENCCINIVSTPKTCLLSINTNINKVYGAPVYTAKIFTHAILYKSRKIEKSTERLYSDIDDNLIYFKDKHKKIKNDAIITHSIVSTHHLTLGNKVQIIGDIKVHKDLHISENCHIDGNIFVEGDIYISKHCFIMGNLFSYQNIYIEEGNQIGTETQKKSVIAQGKIKLEKNIAIYNYILADQGIQVL